MVVDFREKLLECLGGPWPESGELNPRVVESRNQDGYRLETVSYEVEPGQAVRAFLLIPDGADASHPVPGICVWHQHNGQWQVGKAEPAGLAGMAMHHTGVALAKEGYVVLCPDALCFGERVHPHLKGGDYERFEFLRYVVAGKCLAWKHILDMRRAVDYLCSRPEVNKNALGCYGHSMGSTHTWLVGPFEPRLRCLVGNCCLPTYKAIHTHHLLHCFPNFIPGLHQYGDTPDIASLIAPRPFHLNLGENDSGSPIAEARAGLQTIARAYQAVHAEDKFTFYVEPNGGHVLSEEMWRLVKAKFARYLREQ